MPLLLCMGAMLKCPFGSAPSVLAVLPTNKVTGIMPYPNINDHIPMLNIMPFGTCCSMLNPAVPLAQGAPVPCTPMTALPWTNPTGKLHIGAAPALSKDSSLMCIYGGQITPQTTGQVNVTGS